MEKGVLLFFVILLIGFTCIQYASAAKVPTYTPLTLSATTPYIFVEQQSLMFKDSGGKYQEITRSGNYAFEGEKIIANVFVRNPSGKSNMQGVYITIGVTQGVGNDIETICILTTAPKKLSKELLLTIGKSNSNTDQWYKCELTIETSASMHGEYFIGYEAKNSVGELGYFGSWYYFLNPTIALSVGGDLTFEDVRPGTQAYSQTMLLGNDAEAGSGVVLDMFISGTDFYDPSSSGAKCSDNTNKLALSNFRYFATNGGYNTISLGSCNGLRAGADNEGYVGIPRGNMMEQSCEIIGNDKFFGTPNNGNLLTPGSEMALTFKLSMPKPCTGDFSEGQIYFWGKVSDNNPYSPGVGTGVGVSITTEQFAPRIWACGKGTLENSALNVLTRQNNYAFEGESISWKVLVMDKNKIEEIQRVAGTLGPTQGVGNDVEVECKRVTGPSQIPSSCNARIGEEELKTFDGNTMAYYDCKLTVETPASMHGEYFVTVEAMDSTGLSATMAENEYWFLNPTIALSVDGDLSFEDVRPGTTAYSQTLLLGNDAEAGSGVVLDMFISGTDFYDPSSSGALCPTSNVLSLDNLKYYAANGGYSTSLNKKADRQGYLAIPRGDRILSSSKIIDLTKGGGNSLSPGGEMSIKFRLSVPSPCNGSFSEGRIYFWGKVSDNNPYSPSVGTGVGTTITVG